MNHAFHLMYNLPMKYSVHVPRESFSVKIFSRIKICNCPNETKERYEISRYETNEISYLNNI